MTVNHFVSVQFMTQYTLKKVRTFCRIEHGFTLLPLFFKLLAFPQFLRYADEIDMVYHAWMEYDSLKISRRWNERFGF